MRRASLRPLALAAPALLLAPVPAAACTVSTGGVAFGTYSTSNASPTDSAGTLTLACHPSASPTISISAGDSGSFAPRRMRNGSFQLNYNLFTTAARTIVWGNGSGGTATVSPTGSVSGGTRHFSVPVYGRIPAGQNAGAGSYADTLMVTVAF